MADPFALALVALMNGPASAAAIYTPRNGDPMPIRVTREQGTDDQGNLMIDTNVVRIARTDVGTPMPGDALAIGAEKFVIQGGARIDAEGLTWKCDLQTA